MKIALLLTALILVAAYLYSLTIDKREAALHLSHEIPYGPFTIKVSGRVSTGFNVNESIRSPSNMQPRHVDETPVGGWRDVPKSQVLQCDLARLHILKQGTWGSIFGEAL